MLTLHLSELDLVLIAPEHRQEARVSIGAALSHSVWIANDLYYEVVSARNSGHSGWTDMCARRVHDLQELTEPYGVSRGRHVWL